jgi:hypothetical protein
VCDRPVELGPGVWEGRAIPQWGKLVICQTCEDLNHDGIIIRTFPDLPRRIEAAGGRFTKNAEGHIVVPRPGSN